MYFLSNGDGTPVITNKSTYSTFISIWLSEAFSGMNCVWNSGTACAGKQSVSTFDLLGCLNEEYSEMSFITLDWIEIIKFPLYIT